MRTSSRVCVLLGLLGLQLLAAVTSTEVVVVVTPPVVVATPTSSAAFACSPVSSSASAVIVDIEWVINGKIFDYNNTNVELGSINNIRVLLFINVSVDDNNTQIQCTANTTTHGVVTSGAATLLVQGSLSAVELTAIRTESDLNVRWTAPFSLDNNDISYCVDVVSSTSSATLHSECEITVTQFTYSLPPRSGCDVYNFTITPVNMVGNGTRASIEYSGAMSRPGLQQVIPPWRTMEYMLIMSAPVCSSQVTLVDIDTGESITLGDTDLTIAETNITFTTQQLRQNRHYNVTVTASNVAGSATSEYGEQISTHDITSCSCSQGVREIDCSATFTQNSNVTGALFNFIFINEIDGSVDFSKSLHQAFNRSDVSREVLLPLDLFHRGLYIMYGYDIEENMQLENGIGYQACTESNVAIPETQTTLSRATSDSCNITSLAGLITVMCPFPFQMSAQISDPDRVRVLHINTTTETQTPVTVQVMENGEYRVTVFPIQEGVGILSGQIHINDILLTTQVATTATTTRTTSEATGTAAVVGGVVGAAVVVIMVTLV